MMLNSRRRGREEEPEAEKAKRTRTAPSMLKTSSAHRMHPHKVA